MGLKEKWQQYKQHKQEYRTFMEKRDGQTLEDLLLSAKIGVDEITKEQALSIPGVSSAVNIISNTVAMIPINLYKEIDGKKSLVEDDNRVKLLNNDTKDTLDGFQFKKAMVADYLLEGGGYAYINKVKNDVVSLNYVNEENIGINKNSDPIFKDYDILVNGKTYRPFEFIKILRKTKDGANGKGVIEENNSMLTIAYLRQQYEQVLLRTGGNKKGFIKSENRLDQSAIDILKQSWKNLYSNNTENVVVLNKGLDFTEAGSTSVEMQLNENKQTDNSNIYEIFSIPPKFPEISEDEYNNFIKVCILPILKAIITALNKDLLLESEKNTLYFAVDINELLKGDILKRYQAYQIGINTGILQWDEVRHNENLEPYGVDFIKLGLQDVLYDPKTKQVYTPNTNKTAVMGQDSTDIDVNNSNIIDNKESNHNEGM